jgi:hypothetical protein
LRIAKFKFGILGCGEVEETDWADPDYEIRNSKFAIPTWLQPFTQTTCLISATISTKSSWFFITASIDL